eukprot:2826138-Prymnesium_polylepis.1
MRAHACPCVSPCAQGCPRVPMGVHACAHACTRVPLRLAAPTASLHAAPRPDCCTTPRVPHLTGTKSAERLTDYLAPDHEGKLRESRAIAAMPKSERPDMGAQQSAHVGCIDGGIIGGELWRLHTSSTSDRIPNTAPSPCVPT